MGDWFFIVVRVNYHISYLFLLLRILWVLVRMVCIFIFFWFGAVLDGIFWGGDSRLGFVSSINLEVCPPFSASFLWKLDVWSCLFFLLLFLELCLYMSVLFDVFTNFCIAAVPSGVFWVGAFGWGLVFLEFEWVLINLDCIFVHFGVDSDLSGILLVVVFGRMYMPGW